MSYSKKTLRNFRKGKTSNTYYVSRGGIRL